MLGTHLVHHSKFGSSRSEMGHSRPGHRAPPPSPFPLRSESDRKCLAQNRLKFGKDANGLAVAYGVAISMISRQ